MNPDFKHSKSNGKEKDGGGGRLEISIEFLIEFPSNS